MVALLRPAACGRLLPARKISSMTGLATTSADWRLSDQRSAHDMPIKKANLTVGHSFSAIVQIVHPTCAGQVH
jgi:hypothetical protein